MQIFKNIVTQALKPHLYLSEERILQLLETPPDSKMGDFAFPCFSLSKALRRAPNIIATELAQKLDKSDYIEKTEAVGGYINFYMEKNYFIETILDKVLKEQYNYGSSTKGNGKNIVIDYSSVNIAKPMHIGHLPTTVIGNSLYKIYEFLGYKCIGINHLGDWGTQFGKLIVAYKNWGNHDEISKDPINKLVELYVRFHNEAEKDRSLEDDGRLAFKQIEDGNPEYVELWKWFVKLTLDEVGKIYDTLNIKFDSYNGESFYIDKMGPIIKELEQKSLLVTSDGARIVDLEQFNMPPFIAQRSDGATLYATRDLAAVFYRMENYNFEKAIYVVAIEQNLHFKQLFKVVELMGYDWYKNLVHVNYGMVSLESGAMSTRKGNTVYLKDVINEAVEKAGQIIKDRDFDMQQKEEIAKKVGIGAVIFSSLANSRIKDVVFSYDKILNFDGETAPYIQYTYARICSIFRKTDNNDIENINFSALNDENSLQVISLLGRFPEIVASAAVRYEPSFISRYLIDLSQAFNKFYYFNPILSEENSLKNARLALCKSTQYVLKTGLTLLGIDCVDKM